MQDKNVKMKLFCLCCLASLIYSCTQSDEIDKKESQDTVLHSEIVVPLDTLEIIETNYWTALVDSFHFPVYLNPVNHSTEFMGREYHFLDLENEIVSFGGCSKGTIFDFSAKINRITEDSLVLEFIEENENFFPKGSLLFFKNDREFFHEDFQLERLSYSSADFNSSQELYSVEFDELNYYVHVKDYSSGTLREKYLKGEMTNEFFTEAQNQLSKIRLNTIEDYPIDPNFYPPFKLMVEFNGKSERLEGDKLSIPPRFEHFITFIENKTPEQAGDTTTIVENFFNFILNGELHESLTEIDSYSFKVGELKLDERFRPAEIEEEVDIEYMDIELIDD